MRPGGSRRGTARATHLNAAATIDPGAIEIVRHGDQLTVRIGGRMTLGNAEPVSEQLAALDAGGATRAVVDLGAVKALDTAGAWILFRFLRRLEGAGVYVELTGNTEAQAALLQRMTPVVEERRSLRRPGLSPVLAMVERVGRAVFSFAERASALVSFFGVVAIALLRTAVRPSSLRLISVLSHVEQIGLNALPIVGLISFLVGVVLAYQGADQLRAIRRRDLHRQPGRHLRPARDGHPADRDRGRRPLGLRLHRADRHHAGERGGRCAAHASASTRWRCW